MHHAFPFLARQAPAAERELQDIAQWLDEGELSASHSNVIRASTRRRVAQAEARGD